MDWSGERDSKPEERDWWCNTECDVDLVRDSSLILVTCLLGEEEEMTTMLMMIRMEKMMMKKVTFW